MSETTHIPWSADDPIVTVTISEPELMSVHVFGLPFRPPADLLPLTRASFGKVMDILWGQYRQPLTVQIIETDGTRQTGVIDLETTSQPDVVSNPIAPVVPPPADTQIGDATQSSVNVAARRADDQTPPPVYPTEPVEEASWVHLLDTIEPDPDEPETLTSQPNVTTDTRTGSFLPGEQISVALLAGLTTADQYGQHQADIPGWLAGQVYLIGRSSGVVRTMTTRR